jgi:hypothetical protein
MFFMASDSKGSRLQSAYSLPGRDRRRHLLERRTGRKRDARDRSLVDILVDCGDTAEALIEYGRFKGRVLSETIANSDLRRRC